MTRYVIDILDESNESAKLVLNTSDTPADADLTALHNSLGNICQGGIGEGTLQSSVVKDGTTPVRPTDAYAQREIRWLLSYQDNVTNELYTKEIPCADLSKKLPTSDDLNMADADVVTFTGAFNTAVVSPNGNAVSLLSGKFIGKRS